MTEIACPRCGKPLTLNPDAGMFRCDHCGFKRAETLDEASERIRASGQRPHVPITYRGTLDPRVRSLWESGHDTLWRGDSAAALDAFTDALDIQPDFVDAHLWIAKTSPDPRVQRDHLGEVLARDPGNLDALRMLMVLNGEITPEEAERSRDGHTPILKRAEQPIKAQTAALLCPVCGGALTIDEANGRVVCRFCGHTAPLDTARHASDGAAVLGAALLKRRAQTERWIVGERILHCTQCGAERTIPAARLSTACPFCGSMQVIEQDALHSIEPPDGVIPFAIHEEQAKAAVRERLKGVDQRIAGLLDDNQIARASIEGLYLPFWVFDALAEISRTTLDRRTPSRYERARPIQPYQHERFNDGMMGVCVAAVSSPPDDLTDAIREFDVSAAVAYDPRLLAKFPAELYDVDFDAASLRAQSVISAHMRQRHGRQTRQNTEVTVFTSVLQMSFTLLLMPVWVATLYERDGDVRPALVNGQTGQVALGKAKK